MGEAGHQAEIDIGMTLAQSAQRFRKKSRHGRMNGADAQHPARHVAAQAVAQRLPDLHNLPGALDECAAALGEHRRPPAAVEDEDAKLLLERADLEADARLGEIELPRRIDEIAVVDDGEDRIEAFDVHWALSMGLTVEERASSIDSGVPRSYHFFRLIIGLAVTAQGGGTRAGVELFDAGNDLLGFP